MGLVTRSFRACPLPGLPQCPPSPDPTRRSRASCRGRLPRNHQRDLRRRFSPQPARLLRSGLERLRDLARVALPERAVMTDKNDEQLRLETPFADGEGWKKWGPYLSERQWGTVREDYSPHGNAWDYF